MASWIHIGRQAVEDAVTTEDKIVFPSLKAMQFSRISKPFRLWLIWAGETCLRLRLLKTHFALLNSSLQRD